MALESGYSFLLYHTSCYYIITIYCIITSCGGVYWYHNIPGTLSWNYMEDLRTLHNICCEKQIRKSLWSLDTNCYYIITCYYIIHAVVYTGIIWKYYVINHTNLSWWHALTWNYMEELYNKLYLPLMVACLLMTCKIIMVIIAPLATHLKTISLHLLYRCESQHHNGHLTSKTVPVLPSVDPSLIFPFHLLPSPVYPTGFSICIFPGFLAIFILLSSNNKISPFCHVCLCRIVNRIESSMVGDCIDSLSLLLKVFLRV